MCKIDDKTGKEIVDLYNNGTRVTDIYRLYNQKYSVNMIRNYLIKFGIYRFRKFHGQLTYEECVLIGELYRIGNYEEIYKLHPDLSLLSIRSICGKLGVKREGYYWPKEDIEYFVSNYGKIPTDEIVAHFGDKYKRKTLTNKAHKLGLKGRLYWTEQEDEILQKYYSTIPMENLLLLLSDRTKEAIVTRAKKYKLKSYLKLIEAYTEEQLQFVIDNWQKMTDEEIATLFNRSPHGIRDLRARLGLCRANKEYAKYEDIIKLFRGHISDWKTQSIKACNYECILTGDSDFDIHHPYGFNMIVYETFKEIEKEIELVSLSPTDYTKELLDRMLEIFSEIHSKYPLGICVRKDIHKLFHKIYGSGGNTPEQWDAFVEKYKNGEYNDILN